jgi:hypothetical protein
MVLLLEIHTNALSKRRGGSRRNTFMITPVVWKIVRVPKTGRAKSGREIFETWGGGWGGSMKI